MKTDHLIAALAADSSGPSWSARRGLWFALCFGLVTAGIAFVATMGARADLEAALRTWRFDTKLILVGAAVLAALVDCVRQLRPEVRPSLHWSTATLVVLVLISAVLELIVTPRPDWGARLIGTNGLLCLVAIPLLSLAPFLAVLWALRHGAPASPAWAGAAAGRLASSIGAAFYALHCFDDSPLFVAAWYSAAVLILSAIGAVVGTRLLKW